MAEKLNRNTVEEAFDYIIETGCTLREASRKFGICKSSIHDYATKRKHEFSEEKIENVLKVLEKNKSERTARGGNSTKEKWRKIKNGN